MNKIATVSGIAALSLIAGPALAHTGIHETSGFAAGISHPIGGADHVLAMVVVGIWSALVGGRALWAWPAAFVGAMLVAAGLGMAGIAVPLLEPGILASVVVLGLLAALAVRLPVGIGAALVGAFALFHGNAHGIEAPVAASGLAYMAGFALATAALHGAGLGLGVALTGTLGRTVLRLGGAAGAAGGLVLALA